MAVELIYNIVIYCGTVYALCYWGQQFGKSYLHFLKHFKGSNSLIAKKLDDRSFVVIEEAKKRGIDIFVLSYRFQFFRARKGKREFFFSYLPLANNDFAANLMNDKLKCKRELQKRQMPTAAPYPYRFFLSALRNITKEDYPLVVKPRFGSISEQVTINICSKWALFQAIMKVRLRKGSWLIEKQVKGNVYRATIVKHKLMGVLLRYPYSVIGDGYSNIAKLINRRNVQRTAFKKARNRLPGNPIKITRAIKKFLENNRQSLQFIPKKNKRVPLTDIVQPGLGADGVDVTDSVHTDNRILFEGISIFFDAEIVGIDFIIQDITKSYTKQSCAVIDLNPVPFIQMHHFPFKGRPRNIAGAIWDAVLNKS